MRGRTLARRPLSGSFSNAPPNRTGPFPSIRLLGDYCVGVAVGCRASTVSWQARQATRVLSRLVTMSSAHAGRRRPSLVRSASLRGSWMCMSPVRWQIAHRAVRSRLINSLGRATGMEPGYAGQRPRVHADPTVLGARPGPQQRVGYPHDAEPKG
jgi:hypothetical protein